MSAFKQEHRSIITCKFCGRSNSLQTWLALALLGAQRDEYGNTVAELRKCPCGHSLCLDVEGPGFFGLGIEPRHLTVVRNERELRKSAEDYFDAQNDAEHKAKLVAACLIGSILCVVAAVVLS